MSTPTAKKPANLYALAVNKNREQMNKAIQHEEKYGPAWRQAQERHERAWMHPSKGPEAAIRGALVSWLEYADHYAATYSQPIGEDFYTAPAWEEWGRQIRHLLSMDCGRFDCGTLDAIILDAAAAAGCPELGL